MDRCLLTFIIGIGVGFLTPASGAIQSLWIPIGVALAASVLAIAAVFATRTLPLCRFIATLIVALFCGIALTTANLNWLQGQKSQLLKSPNGKLTVQIESVPKHYQHYARFVARIIPSKGVFAANQRLIVRWYGTPPNNLQQGQQWRLEVKLKPFKNYWNEGSDDYVARQYRRHVFAYATVQSGVLLQPPNNARSRLLARYTAMANDGSEHAGLLAALTVGTRSLLTYEQRQQWQHNGLSHALAISGLHLTLVGWAGLWLGRRLVQRWLVSVHGGSAWERHNVGHWALVPALLIACCYAWLAGFSIATERALIMFILVALHHWLAITVTPWRLLLRTVAVLLALDPLAWLDVGFWLSISALVTIFLTLWRWRTSANGLAALLRLQLMFLMCLAPLSLHWFGGLSLLSPLTNLLVLPVLSVWVLPLALLGALSELSFAHQLADNLWYLSLLPLDWAQPLLQSVADASINWWQPSWQIPSWIVTAIWPVILWPHFSQTAKWALALIVPLTLLAWYTTRDRNSDVQLHVLDVGQSQAVVIERRGRAWLVDTAMGYGNGYSLAESVIEPFLDARDLQLEGVWVSHSDADHSGGVGYLKARYPSISWFGAGQERACEAGMAGHWNGIRWRVLWPEQEPTTVFERVDNNHSCVLWLAYKDFSMLLPGDIEFSSERRIAETKGFPSVDVLVAPHHGSKTSSGWLMLKQTKPSLILLSNGTHRGFDFPHRYTVQRYQALQKPWFNSKDLGQLSVRSDGHTWQLKLPMQERRQRLMYEVSD